MSSTLRVWLRPGEKIYINGAVLKTDRKVCLEFLNEVTFLMENHVMQADQTTTPLRQLYFIIQTMLIDPAGSGDAQAMFTELHTRLMTAFANPQILAELERVGELMSAGRRFEALKLVRTLFPLEEKVLRPEAPARGGGAGPEFRATLLPCE